jgi:hypothetical protein
LRQLEERFGRLEWPLKSCDLLGVKIEKLRYLIDELEQELSRPNVTEPKSNLRSADLQSTSRELKKPGKKEKKKKEKEKEKEKEQKEGKVKEKNRDKPKKVCEFS